MKLSVLAASILFGGAAWGQSTNGAITGVVTDPSRGVVAGAQVQIVNQNTRDTRSAVSNEAGFYSFADLGQGTYDLSVTAPGFSTTQRKDLTLLAREEVRVDLNLQLGSAGSESVEVRGTPVVTEGLTLSDSKSGDEINSLALNFRATATPSPLVVANLAPLVQSDSSGNITVGGQLPTATSFSVDGISTQLPRYGGPNKDLYPSVESFAEFRVNTVGNNAEFAQPTDITVITRGGTNDFHGSGYWFFQRQSMNSADQISHIVPNGDADTFGAVISGPLTIPGVYKGKDKTFFYFDYEGIRLDLNTLISTYTPPAAWRTGDFSGSGYTIVDPLSGQPFLNNKIPLTRINATSAAALPLFFPNPTNNATQLSSPNFSVPYPGTYQSDAYDGRLDHAFNSKHRIWGRISQKNIPFTGTDVALGALGAGDTTYNPLMGPFSVNSDLTNLVGYYTWTISPIMVNEFRAGWSRGDFTFSYPQATEGNSIIQQLGITGLPGPPKNGLGGVPVFYIGDFMGGQTNPFGHPRVNKNDTIDFGDNLSLIKGRHTMKFGGEFRRLSYQDNITFLLGDEYGDYFFTGNYTSQGVTKNADVHGFADFLLGYVGDAQQAQNGPDGKPYGFHYGMFAQDEWRIRTNFTFTMGLRYEINTPFNDQTNQLGNFDRNYPGGRLVVQGTKGLTLINPLWKAAVGNVPFVTNSQVGLPSTLRYTYWDNLQPRLGFSWKPSKSDNTVVRSSFGIYSVPVLGAVLYSLLGVDTSYFADYPSTLANPRTFPDVFAGNNTIAPHPSYRRANQYDLKDPRVIQWNFSIDHDIGNNTLVRGSYTGSHTYNLIYSPDLNQVAPNTWGYSALTATDALRQQYLRYPNFAEVLTRDNGPSMKYNALTLELNKRFGRGLTFDNNYTFAHSTTNALGAVPNGAIPVGGQGDNGNNVANYYNIASDYGNSYYTRRHRFVSSFVYDLPFGRGQKFGGNVSRAANLLVGGWRVTGVTLLQSGPWLTPYFSSTLSDPSGTNPTQRSVSQQRPDCLPGQTGYEGNPTTALYFNPAAFTVPASNIGRFGTCGSGILEGPATATFSMSAGKNFALTERVFFRYEAQFANLFNVLNRSVPNMNVGSSGFGQITQSQTVEQAGPRSIQMTLRLSF